MTDFDKLAEELEYVARHAQGDFLRKRCVLRARVEADIEKWEKAARAIQSPRLVTYVAVVSSLRKMREDK